MSAFVIGETTSADPRLLGALRKTGGGGAVLVGTLGKRSRNSISSVARYAFNFFLVRARDCTKFTLHGLADFYVESVTAHCIKINVHSCFHNRWPNSKMKLKLIHL